jgi:hypothetical protein
MVLTKHRNSWITVSVMLSGQDEWILLLSINVLQTVVDDKSENKREGVARATRRIRMRDVTRSAVISRLLDVAAAGHCSSSRPILDHSCEVMFSACLTKHLLFDAAEAELVQVSSDTLFIVMVSSQD